MGTASAALTANANVTMDTTVTAAVCLAGHLQPAMGVGPAAGQARVSVLQRWGLVAPAAINVNQVFSELHATSTVLIRRLATGVVNATIPVGVSALVAILRLSTAALNCCLAAMVTFRLRSIAVSVQHTSIQQVFATDTAARLRLAAGTACAMSTASVSAIFTSWATTVAFAKLHITDHLADLSVTLRLLVVAMGAAHRLDIVSVMRIISANFAISANRTISGPTAQYTALQMKPVVGMVNATALESVYAIMVLLGTIATRAMHSSTVRNVMRFAMRPRHVAVMENALPSARVSAMATTMAHRAMHAHLTFTPLVPIPTAACFATLA
eukprot:COSAG02_NODE_6498_length_3537_cov_2.666085_4_plen_327_part_00